MCFIVKGVAKSSVTSAWQPPNEPNDILLCLMTSRPLILHSFVPRPYNPHTLILLIIEHISTGNLNELYITLHVK